MGGGAGLRPGPATPCELGLSSGMRGSPSGKVGTSSLPGGVPLPVAPHRGGATRRLLEQRAAAHRALAQRVRAAVVVVGPEERLGPFLGALALGGEGDALVVEVAEA